jgi:hypothetical protein
MKAKSDQFRKNKMGHYYSDASIFGYPPGKLPSEVEITDTGEKFVQPDAVVGEDNSLKYYHYTTEDGKKHLFLYDA